VKSCLVAVILALVASAFGGKGPLPVSFEGVVGLSMIWMDLRIPQGNGKISGSYFYYKYGKEIALEGERKKDKLTLRESFKGRATGGFKLNYVTFPIEMEGVARVMAAIDGTWNKPGGGERLEVSLSQEESSRKACYLINAKDLKLNEGGTFAGKMEKFDSLFAAHPTGAHPEDSVKWGYRVIGCSERVFSVHYTYTHYQGDMDECQDFRHTFDRDKKQEIRLWSEIDSAQRKNFTAYMKRQLHPKLADLEHAPGGEEMGIYLFGRTFSIGFANYFGVSRLEASEKGYPLDAYTEVPFEELKPFLKKNSVLRSLEGWADSKEAAVTVPPAMEPPP
jgi:hypothetical protein